MLASLRAHLARPTAVVVGAAALVAVTAGVTLAATPPTYKACANASHQLGLENSRGNCPAHFGRINLSAQGPRGSAGPAGPQGPSGVVSMSQYAPSSANAVTGGWEFLGSAPEEYFLNSDTAAEVVGTVDEASTDGQQMSSYIGVCYEFVGLGGTVINVSEVHPEFTALANSWFAQSVSGDIGGLTGGNYYVGLCAAYQTNTENGLASVTITMANTSSGISHYGMKAGPRARFATTQ